MTFSDYFAIMRVRWRIWVSAVVIGLLAGTAVSAMAPVKYTASATSFVTVGEGSSGDAEIFQTSQFAVLRVKSYASLVDSPQVLDPVIDGLGLDLTTRELADRTTLTSPPDTVLMEVAVTDASPEAASTIANSISIQLGEVIEEVETVRQQGGPNVKVSITKPAAPPVTPSSPRTLLNMLLGVVAGLAIGVFAAVFRHRLDRRIKSFDALRNVTGMSPLGTTSFRTSWASKPLVALDWRSDAAESYRTIRTALKFASIGKDLRHIAITSPGMGEGKTTTACNLAVSWAQSGVSVCLVEADLRRPRVATFLGIEGNPGLSDLLVEEASLDDVLVPWNRGMLTVLPAGSLPPDPAALLGSDAMRGLVETLGERFDIVIFDSPPMLPVTDAVALGAHVDGLVLTVQFGRTKRDEVQRCMEIVDGARLTLLGSVLTAVRRRGRSRHHAYAADHSIVRPELAPLSAQPRDVIPSDDDWSEAPNAQNAGTRG